MPCRRQACGCDIPCPAPRVGKPGLALKLRPPRVATRVPVKRTCGSGSRHGSSNPARDWCDATALPIHPAHGSDRAPSFRGETSCKMRPRPARPPLPALPAPVRRSATNSETRHRSSRAARSPTSERRAGAAARFPVADLRRAFEVCRVRRSRWTPVLNVSVPRRWARRQAQILCTRRNVYSSGFMFCDSKRFQSSLT